MCHGELARDRPSPHHLTEFYLWISVGGVLGGIFNGLQAPMIFTVVAEYPIALVVAGMLGIRQGDEDLSPPNLIRDKLLACFAGLVTWGLGKWALSMSLVAGPSASALVLGDARLSMRKATDQQFNLIDLSKLTAQGVLAFHISNLHMDLKPVLEGLARDAGLVCLVQNDAGQSVDEREEGKYDSLWVVLTHAESIVAALAANSRWVPYPLGAPVKLWTDQTSSILDILILR
jgi:hypothetical protein